MTKLGTWKGLVTRKARLAAIVGALAVLIGGAAAGYWQISRAEHHYRLGLDAVTRQDFQAARRSARRLTAMGDVPRASTVEGAVLMRSGDYVKALETLSLASQQVELAPLVNALGGEALLQLQQIPESLLALTRAIDADPYQPEARRFLGALYFGNDDLAQAFSHLEQAASLSPRNPGPCSLLGHLLQQQGDHEQAVEWFRESMRRGPQQPDKDSILRDLAVSLIHLEQFDAAREELARCEPTVAAMGLLAECHRGQGQTSEAHAAIDKALALAPYDLRCLLFKGDLALDQGDGPTAVDCMSQIVQLQPNESTIRDKLAAAYRLVGDEDRAAGEESMAQRLRDRWSRLRELNQQAQQQPDNVEARLEMATLARELDLLPLAAQCYKAILEIDPAHEEAKASLVAIAPSRPATDAQNTASDQAPSGQDGGATAPDPIESPAEPQADEEPAEPEAGVSPAEPEAGDAPPESTTGAAP